MLSIGTPPLELSLEDAGVNWKVSSGEDVLRKHRNKKHKVQTKHNSQNTEAKFFCVLAFGDCVLFGFCDL